MDKRKSLFLMTSPYSSYIKVRIHFPEHQPILCHAYIDTRSTFCVIRHNLVPTKYWNTVAPGYTLNSSIQYDQQALLLIQIQDKLFHIRLYGYPSLDPDLLLGKNFLLQFHSVMQTKQSLTFVTPCLHSVRCARLLTAYAHHDVRFQAKRGSLVYYSHATENDTSQYQALFEQAKRTFTEDPLAFWERD